MSGRYANFWVVHAKQGGGSLTSAANKATFCLFNDSQASEYIVVRDWLVGSSLAGIVTIAQNQVNLNGAPQKTVSIMGDDTPKPGLLTAADSATVIPADFPFTLAANQPWQWPHDIPFRVLRPGWALNIQFQTSVSTLTVALTWEGVRADDLESIIEKIREETPA